MKHEFTEKQISQSSYEINDGNGTYLRYTLEGTSFMDDDFREVFPDIKFVTLTDIYVNKDYRRRGLGSLLIRYFTDKFQDYAILTAAGASCAEYEDEPSDIEKYIIVEKLKPFYIKNNFIDINLYIAEYETKCAYMYLNKIGEECFNKLVETSYNHN